MFFLGGRTIFAIVGGGCFSSVWKNILIFNMSSSSSINNVQTKKQTKQQQPLAKFSLTTLIWKQPFLWFWTIFLSSSLQYSRKYPDQILRHSTRFRAAHSGNLYGCAGSKLLWKIFHGFLCRNGSCQKSEFIQMTKIITEYTSYKFYIHKLHNFFHVYTWHTSIWTKDQRYLGPDLSSIRWFYSAIWYLFSGSSVVE